MMLFNNAFHYIFDIRYYFNKTWFFPDRPVPVIRQIRFDMFYNTARIGIHNINIIAQ